MEMELWSSSQLRCRILYTGAPWLRPAGTTYGQPSSPAAHGRPGSTKPHTAHRRPIYPGTAAKVSGNNQSQRSKIETSLAPTHRPTKGRAQHSIDHDRRCRL